MTTILEIERHAPDCLVNPDAVKAMMALEMKKPELFKKYGVTQLGLWYVKSEHFVVYVFEAPSFEAFLQLQDEPEVEHWRMHTTAEFKVAMNGGEVAKLLQKAASK